MADWFQLLLRNPFTPANTRKSGPGMLVNPSRKYKWTLSPTTRYGKRLKRFRRCRMGLKFQADHSPHLEASVCFRYTAPWSAQKRGRGETESVPVRLYSRGTGVRKCGAHAACGMMQRTCARLCHQAGGELEQMQFLLGHVSIETTERYLGCKQGFKMP